MNRIGIAISGGPNPAEIVELVVLAESLGYASAWVARAWKRPVRDPGGLRDADVAHPSWYQHQ
jgi:alkanesulfonate monooxygenase SsuD/methylene tetrahydromethanopterin reductase-like flavin-dependent oxidoreductase (luciferase family)